MKHIILYIHFLQMVFGLAQAQGKKMPMNSSTFLFVSCIIVSFCIFEERVPAHR